MQYLALDFNPSFHLLYWISLLPNNGCKFEDEKQIITVWISFLDVTINIEYWESLDIFTWVLKIILNASNKLGCDLCLSEKQ